MAAHRYWQFFVTASVGADYAAVQEIELRETAGGADVTTPSMTVTQSTGGSPGGGTELIDNDFSDLFIAWYVPVANLPQWVKIDLGAGNAKDIAQLAVWPQNRQDLADARSPSALSLSYSDDDVTYTDAGSFTGQSGWTIGTPKLFTINSGGGGGGNAAPTFPGNIANFTCTVGTAITPRNVSGEFSDTDALTFSETGTWPSWAVLNPTTGIITGTPDAAATFSSCTVTATDTASQTVASNTFSFTTSASGGGSGSVTLPALGNNTNTGPRGTTAVYWSYFQGWRVGDAITISPIHGTGTTNSSGVLTISSGLPSGTSGTMKVGVRNNSNPAQDDVYDAWVTIT